MSIDIYGARATFIVFFYHQDTEFESQGIKIGVSGPILTQKKKQRIYATIISKINKISEKIVVIIHIYGARANFYCFVITKTLNLSHKVWKLV